MVSATVLFMRRVQIREPLIWISEISDPMRKLTPFPVLLTKPVFVHDFSLPMGSYCPVGPPYP